MTTRFDLAVAGCAVAALLWTAPARAVDDAASSPGDDAMTCEQIAMELSGYAQQIMPNIQAMGTSQQQLYAIGQQKSQQRRIEDAMLLPLAQAGALDPTGASKRAYQAAVIAKLAKERAENEALANSPLAQQYKAQSQQVATQAQQMQSDARLQHLVQLGRQKHCDKR